MRVKPLLAAAALGTGLGAGGAAYEYGYLDSSATRAAEDIQLGEKFRQLLMNNAPIRLIYVGPDQEYNDPSDPNFDYKSDADATMIKSGDPSYLNSLKDNIWAETRLLYKPSSIDTVTVMPLDFKNKCIENSHYTKQSRKVLEAAKPGFKPGAINIIVADIIGCEAQPGSTFLGFSSPGENPIITRTGLNKFSETITHEISHSAGLSHAAKLNCELPVTIDNCTNDPNGDRTSLMAKSPSDSALSITDLEQLGLINPESVFVNPLEGEYHVSDKLAKTGELRINAIVIDRPNNEKLYFTWQRDPQALRDDVCEYIDDPKMYEPPQDAFLKTLNQPDGSRKYAECVSVVIRPQDHSLQTRLRTKTGINSLVSRPDRAPDGVGITPSNGEVYSGRELYKDSRVVVSFEGATPNGDAGIIKVHYL
jgi:hypothetical protein